MKPNVHLRTIVVAATWLFGMIPSAHVSAQGSFKEPENVTGTEPVIREVENPSDEKAWTLDGDNAAGTAAEWVEATSLGETPNDLDWLSNTKVGYDHGFVIASSEQVDLHTGEYPFQMRINGWGQLRQTIQESTDPTITDVNKFQLKRGRLIFSGCAFTSDFTYFIQMDGRSSSGDDIRLLDYFLTFDIGRNLWGLDRGVVQFKTGKYKMPFHQARAVSGIDFEFTDRSMASTYFDVNRSIAWGLQGVLNNRRLPLHWELAIFNGLVTGGAETGSAGTLDDNFAYSTRLFLFPQGEWGTMGHADLKGHCKLATRVGLGLANSTIDRFGTTEFQSVRVVDSGDRLSNLFLDNGLDVSKYTVDLYSVDASLKYYGWSVVTEYYFRSISDIRGANLPGLYDHGFWLQMGKFIVPGRLQLLARWSRVTGNSGTLGSGQQSSDEVSGGFAWYFQNQHAKLVVDLTDLDGAPINSDSLDISPGTEGWLVRSQIQFAF